MAENDPKFGLNDDELAALPTVYAGDLFAGKRVVVSGAGTGLGRAAAHLFARLGARVALVGRRAELLEETAGSLARYGNETMVRPMTIRDPDAVAELMDNVWREWGGLDVLVNNAGGQFPQNAIDFSVKGWNAVIDTNLNGTWYMMQNAARRWRDQPGGGAANSRAIVNIVADFWRGMPQIAHTAAARAGVAYLSKSVAVEWAEFGIRVNCIAPGLVETTGFAVYPNAGRKSFERVNPMLRAGDAHDVAEACVYLSAPSGKFITGEVLTIDGGQQMWGDAWPLGKPERFTFED
jgi:citronellol/citronellal dehydrogenase